MATNIFDLTGKIALVTGASRGIGEAIAKLLAEQGAHAIVSSRKLDGCQAVADQITADGGSAEALACHVGSMEQIEEAFATIKGTFGKLDILVNNAGVQFVAPVEAFPTEKWDQILAINLSSAFHTTAAALPGMRLRGWGRVVNIASAHGLTASPFKSAYVAAKHGVVGLTKTVALETAEEPITANAICPGYVLTPLLEAQLPATMEKYGMDRETVIKNIILDRQPSRSFATVEQLAGTCCFLCSNAADQITGTTISMDGGWTAQ